MKVPRGHLCRSVTMDAWTDEQLNKMKLGGNKRLNEFLSGYEIDKMTPIPEKYHSRAAEVCFQCTSWVLQPGQGHSSRQKHAGFP